MTDSNALLENSIRLFVIGRKSWLFVNSVAGANASGDFYSLVGTARASGLEPYTYLKMVLT
jgi:transposase